MVIHSSRQIIFSLTHIEGITLSAGEEADEVAGGAGGMGQVRLVTGLVKDRLLSTPIPLAPPATLSTSSPAPSVIPSMWARLKIVFNTKKYHVFAPMGDRSDFNTHKTC